MEGSNASNKNKNKGEKVQDFNNKVLKSRIENLLIQVLLSKLRRQRLIKVSKQILI